MVLCAIVPVDNIVCISIYSLYAFARANKVHVMELSLCELVGKIESDACHFICANRVSGLLHGVRTFCTFSGIPFMQP